MEDSHLDGFLFGGASIIDPNAANSANQSGDKDGQDNGSGFYLQHVLPPFKELYFEGVLLRFLFQCKAFALDLNYQEKCQRSCFVFD
jgi:hypothetical protein